MAATKPAMPGGAEDARAHQSRRDVAGEEDVVKLEKTAERDQRNARPYVRLAQLQLSRGCRMTWNARRSGLHCTAALARDRAGLGQRFRSQQEEEEGPRPIFPSQAEFHFVRVEYTDLPEYHRFFGFASRGARGEGWWVVDWPDADDHFSQGVQRLTRIATGDPRHMRFTDERLVRLSVGVCDADRLVESERCRNGAAARLPVARRVPGGGRFLGRRSVGDFSRDYGARAAGTRRFAIWPKQIP